MTEQFIFKCRKCRRIQKKPVDYSGCEYCRCHEFDSIEKNNMRRKALEIILGIA